ncbi:extracellular solute-binding protein [Aestuariirhabdus sp. Z084]|uniref:extracellular solute-binding protein n=1 Tax=Aestuariirhabdus haliotis TaxID=2918751 RepID=UPI0020BFC94C|nr:extracellular solute-binding protein [Aestuariirhabdus haliotis]MCL6414194.1 extracellular solute-binding protein [Aestuariirhabdus haliotis]
MKNVIKNTVVGLTAACALTAGSQAIAADRVLHVYNWSDYIAEDTIANFEKKTGIKVSYDVFDSNEVLEAKLLSGGSGFDIVVPSASFMARQIQAGAFQPMDRSKLSNWGNLDDNMMKNLEVYDPGNQYAFPYLWGTTGIGYNPDKVKAALGDAAPVNSWDLIFKPENMEKLAACGVAVLDAPTEMLPAALKYLGKDPNSHNKADYEEATQLLLSVRPHITYFHSSKYISDLANGDICVAVGWSGDVLQAADRAAEAENGVTVEYVIPAEGAGMWFDMLVMPTDAKNVDEAYEFLNYLLDPEVMAEISNYVAYANGNSAATKLVDEEITGNPGIYPTPEAEKNLYPFKVLPKKIDRIVTRAWTKVKSGQ